MLYEITNAKAHADHTVTITWADGARAVVDFTPFIDRGELFAALQAHPTVLRPQQAPSLRGREPGSDFGRLREANDPNSAALDFLRARLACHGYSTPYIGRQVIEVCVGLIAVVQPDS